MNKEQIQEVDRIHELAEKLREGASFAEEREAATLLDNYGTMMPFFYGYRVGAYMAVADELRDRIKEYDDGEPGIAMMLGLIEQAKSKKLEEASNG